MNNQHDKTILLVEDDVIIAMVTALKIQRFGYDVVKAHSGEEAVKIAVENEKISLILMDINLSGDIDGTEAAQQILAVSHLPIVFLTSHTEEEYVSRVKEITRYGYVIKNSGDFVLKSSIDMAFELFQMHEKTRESEELLQAAMDQSQAGIAIADAPDGKLRYVNDAGLLIRGGPRAEIVEGIGVEQYVASWHILHLDGTPYKENDVPLARAVLYGETCREEFIIRRDDHEDRIVLAHAAPIFDVNGHVTAGIVVFLDITARKRLEAERQQEKRFLQQITETSPVGITKVDKKGKIVYANDTAEKVLRLRKSQIQDRTYDDVRWGIVHIDGTPYPEEQLPFTIVRETGNAVYGIEHAIQFPDGTRRLLSINAAPLYDQHGHFDGMVAAIEDITERKKVEDALKESEAKFRNIFTESPIGIELYDLDGKLREVNAACLRIFGVDDAAQVQGFKLFDDPNLPENTKDVLLQGHIVQYETLFDFEQVKQYDLYHTTRSGAISIQVKITQLGIKNEEDFSGYLVHVQDITERKNAEKALKESEEKFQKAFESCPVTMSISTLDDGIFLDVNAEFLKLTGYTREEVVGHKANELGLWNKQSRDTVIAELQAHGSIRNKEFAILDKDGVSISLLWYADIIRINNTPCLIVTGYDLTERKKAEAKLREANDTKDRFFSIIAHDLRNPFLGFLNGTEMLKEHFRNSEDAFAQNISAELHQRAQQLSEFLDNLLTWAQLQRGSMPYMPQNVDLASLSQYTADLLHENAAQKKMSFRCMIEEGTQVSADYNMITAIFRNLLSNAIKFTNPGGAITVKSQNAGEFLEIAISDTGVGMSADKQRKLFNIGEKNTTTSGTAGEKGTGLGLILCKEFVEKHGGKIWVTSEVGQGSTFTFTLPKADAYREHDTA